MSWAEKAGCGGGWQEWGTEDTQKLAVVCRGEVSVLSQGGRERRGSRVFGRRFADGLTIG